MLARLGVDDEDSKTAVFSALLLSNLLANVAGYQAASNALYDFYLNLDDFYLNLGSKKTGHEEYGEWLISNGLNVPRIANAVKLRLKVSM